MAMIRPLRPSLLYPTVVMASDDQTKEALRLTRETLIQLRDLTRELDLPADLLPLVAQEFHVQRQGVLDAAQNARTMKIDAIRARMAEEISASAPQQPPVRFTGGAPRGRYVGLGDCDVYDDLDALSDAEIEKLYAERVVTRAAVRP